MRFFVIIGKNRELNCFTDDVWEIKDIYSQKKKGEFIKEIPEGLWLKLTHDKNPLIKNPILKEDTFNEFLESNLLEWENLEESFDYFFEENVTKRSIDLSLNEKDIVCISEILKNVLIQSPNSRNIENIKSIKTLDDIINRYK